MAARADALGVKLRPHIKTHKCVEIGLGQRELGARGITVSTLEEARIFAAHGFDDITWAFPLVPDRLPEVERLAGDVRLGVVIDSGIALQALRDHRLGIGVWVKVDCGYHRAGVDPASPGLEELAAAIEASPGLAFRGLLSHSGHAYRGRSPEHIRGIAEEERRVMTEAADRLRAAGLEVPEVSVGSTPAMARVESLEGITEVRPGNYALFDYTQAALGSCAIRDCAATVLATVVSCRPGSERSVVNAGALALSLDPGPAHVARRSWGLVLDDYAAGTLMPDARLLSLSQEHGVLSRELPVGQRVRILPNHSCLCVACFDRFHVVEGDRVVDEWPIRRSR